MLLQDVLRLRMRVTLIDSAVQTGQSLFTLVATLIILGFGGYLVVVGQTTLGALVATRSLFTTLTAPARNIFGEVGGLQRALAAADRVFAFLDERPRVRERVGAADPGSVAGAVRFEGVGFAYEPGRPVLRGVSFAAEPGQVVALVGPSGAGKSTLISLIARFYDPDEGRVLLDGRGSPRPDARRAPAAGRHRLPGHVPLRGDRPREHRARRPERRRARDHRRGEGRERLGVRRGAPPGTRHLRRRAGGPALRGPEAAHRHRPGILRDPRLLILDEPTSALDARSEHLLQRALDRLVRDRTTFIIAHRLSTVRRADLILVVEDGQVAEQGTHESLMRQDGLYRELHDLQLTGASSRGESEGQRRAVSWNPSHLGIPADEGKAAVAALPSQAPSPHDEELVS